jgi:hypothetical protein
MNERIERSRTGGSPRWREKNMMITHSGKPNISLHESISMGWSSTSNECKDYSLEKLNKERMKSNLKALRHTKKRPLYADGRRQLGGEPPMHRRSVVKIFYNRYVVSK